VGETILDAELVNIALNGFSKVWEPLILGIYAKEKLPKWEEFGMTSFRRRLVEGPNLESREEVQQMTTYLLSTRQRKEKE
jgi:hypothetical protein